jgi:hypothetical protein
MVTTCFNMQHVKILEKTTANDIVRSRCQLKPPTRSVVVYYFFKFATHSVEDPLKITEGHTYNEPHIVYT